MARVRFPLEGERDYLAAETVAAELVAGRRLTDIAPAGLAPVGSALVLAAGLLESPAPVVDELLGVAPTAPGGAFRWTLAADCVAGGRSRHSGAWARLVEGAEAAWPAWWARHTLYSLSDPEPVLRCLRGRHLQLRRIAEWALALLGRVWADAARDWRHLLLVRSDWAGFYAAGLLGLLGGREPQVIAGLVNAVRDRSWLVQSAAIGSLGRLRCAAPVVVAALAECLGGGRHLVHNEAAEVLLSLGQDDPGAASTVLAALRDTSSPGGKAELAIAKALAEGKCDARAALSQEILRFLLDRLWEQRDGWARLSLAQLLYGFGEARPQVVRAVRECLADGHSGALVAARAAQQLIEWGDAGPEVGGLLTGCLRDDSVGVRLAAVEVLGGLVPADPNAGAAVRRALRDASPRVRVAAAKALAGAGEADGEVEGQLLAGLRSADVTIRLEAVEASAGFPPGGAADAAVTTALVRALRDGPWQVRVRAANLLSRQGTCSPEVIAELLGQLGSRQWWVRLAAARALRHLRGAAALRPELVHALHDRNWRVRGSAAEVLGGLGPYSVDVCREVAVGLLDCLRDRHAEVRRAAARSLCELAGRDGATRRLLDEVVEGRHGSVDADAVQEAVANARSEGKLP